MSVHDQYLLNQHHQASSLYWKMQKKRLFAGDCGIPYARFTGMLMGSMSIQNIFDFGGGSSAEDITKTHSTIINTAKSLFGIEPRIINSENDTQGKSTTECFEGVVSYDVIEHLHPTSVGSCLESLFIKAGKIVVLNISCIKANKLLPDGSNQHSSIFAPETWITLVSSLAINHNKHFALFLTLENHESSLVHNIPYELHDYAFQNFAFYPFPGIKTWFKFFNNKRESLENMSPEERWMKTHLHYLYKRNFNIDANPKIPGSAILTRMRS